MLAPNLARYGAHKVAVWSSLGFPDFLGRYYFQVWGFQFGVAKPMPRIAIDFGERGGQ